VLNTFVNHVAKKILIGVDFCFQVRFIQRVLPYSVKLLRQRLSHLQDVAAEVKEKLQGDYGESDEEVVEVAVLFIDAVSRVLIQAAPFLTTRLAD
jgi:hypothetical protein